MTSFKKTDAEPFTGPLTNLARFKITYGLFLVLCTISSPAYAHGDGLILVFFGFPLYVFTILVAMFAMPKGKKLLSSATVFFGLPLSAYALESLSKIWINYSFVDTLSAVFSLTATWVFGLCIMGYFFSRHLERPPKPARSYLQDLNFHDPLNGMIGRIYGVEPVQAVGSIRGTPFYFKSKDETWNFSVANDIAMDPSDIKSPEQGFYLEGKFENANEGNFLELQAAKRLIEKCIAQYLEKH